MKIDLHNHTTLSSACSILDVKDLISRAKELKIDAVCVTEHNTMYGGNLACEIGKDMGFIVIPGQEIATNYGDILAFGVYEEGLRGIDLKELCLITEKVGGVLIPAHPFRKYTNSIGERISAYHKYFGAIEVLNGNCDEAEIMQAEKRSELLNLKMTGGSDAHSKRMVGRYYTVFDTDTIIDTPSKLIEAIKTLNFFPEENPLWDEK